MRLEVEGQSEADLVFLLAHDSDDFNRWEAGQRLGRALLLRLYEASKDVSKVLLLILVRQTCLHSTADLQALPWYMQMY